MKAAIHHVNVTVPKSLEEAAKHFYGVVMGLEEVPKPAESKGRGGAWYQLGLLQLHLSIEDGIADGCLSKRHVCYTVENLADAEEKFRSAGVEIRQMRFPQRAGPDSTYETQVEIDWRLHKQCPICFSLS